MAATLEVGYYNTFWLKKVVNDKQVDVAPAWSDYYVPIINNPDLGPPDPTKSGSFWYIEEARINGGYNNTIVDLGVRAYLVEEEPNLQRKQNGLIYSGIYNSSTGFNAINVFSTADTITKAVDPAFGSIQKLYAEDSNLTIFQERKVNRALIDKDAIYSAEGGGTVTSSNTVIGQIVPYGGEWGISKNPESFAVYGYRKYFVDANKSVVLRLSNDGITEISSYGMIDWFRDNLANVTSSGKIKGAWDINNKSYVLSLQDDINSYYSTLMYDEQPQGWVSFLSFIPEQMGSLRNKFYSIKDGNIWRHYSNDVNRSNFYNTNNASTITFIANEMPSAVKEFLTINYEGTDNWEMSAFKTDYEGATPIKSYIDGSYLEPGVQELQYAGFWEKENKYFSNLSSSGPNNTVVATKYKGRVLVDDTIGEPEATGAKGFYSEITMSIGAAGTSVIGQPAELFAVSTKFNISSY
jgi:hypothetical protein